MGAPPDVQVSLQQGKAALLQASDCAFRTGPPSTHPVRRRHQVVIPLLPGIGAKVFVTLCPATPQPDLHGPLETIRGAACRNQACS